MACSIFAFDAYGTLFDVHAAVRRHATRLGEDAATISSLWRAKQLEYSWVRALAGRYVDFWNLTEQALDTALATFGRHDPEIRTALLAAYRSLDCYPEVPEIILGLRAQGKQLAVLSNGTPAMLASAVSAAGLDGCFDAILSTDAVSTFKTDSRVYDLLTTQFRCYPDDVSFQSSNRWDIAGATACGFRTVWINRDGAPAEYLDLPPAATLPTLNGLLRLG